MQGTHLEWINGPRLTELRDQIRSFPFKVEIKEIVCKPSGEWYIFFTLEDNVIYKAQNDISVNRAIDALDETNKKRVKR